MYFNENDPFAAQWLSKLFPEAVIDQRSIVDVKADDLVRYERCHFFGGIGGWELALQLAGWPRGRKVWSGSCPCPPFSSAGRKKCKLCGAKVWFIGDDEFGCLKCEWRDPRHLWPQFRRLIADGKPATVVGEQVASADGREWLSRVRADLEKLGYAVGAADLCAAGVGAPHMRQRLFWVAHSNSAGKARHSKEGPRANATHAGVSGHVGGMGHADRTGSSPRGSTAASDRHGSPVVADGSADGMAVAEHAVGRKIDGPVKDEFNGRDAGRQEAHGVTGTRGEVRGLGVAAEGRRGQGRPATEIPAEESRGAPERSRLDRSGLGDSFQSRLEGHSGHGSDGNEPGRQSAQTTGSTPAASGAGGVADTSDRGCGTGSSPASEVRETGCDNDGGTGPEMSGELPRGPEGRGGAGFWSEYDVVICRDLDKLGRPKARRIEPGTFPLAHGVPNRVGRLRGYGNAIPPHVGAQFIEAFLEAERALR